MMQVPLAQTPQYQQINPPNYNAVKIDIHNPQVSSAPNYAQNPSQAPVYTAPMYNYPQAQIYEIPANSVYGQSQAYTPPPVVNVPQPVVVHPSPIEPTKPVEPVTATVPVAPVAPKSPEPVKAEVNNANSAVASQKVEVVAPEISVPKVDLNAFIAKLTSPDYEQQAAGMEAIALMAQKTPEQATELIDVKVVEALSGIINNDSSKLEGPTPKQLEIRDKIIHGKTVSDAEMKEASKISPMEQAERNKMYAMYTVAILDKLFGSEIEKLDKSVVPLTELPAAANIVEQVKSNPNPMVRAAAIDALSYIARAEYKQDLTTIFTVAKNDKDPNVQQAATVALDKLSKMA